MVVPVINPLGATELKLVIILTGNPPTPTLDAATVAVDVTEIVEGFPFVTETEVGTVVEDSPAAGTGKLTYLSTDIAVN